MKKTITIYELLGKVKDNKDNDIYVKYMNKMTEKEDTMWSCVENIIDKLDNKVIYLNDEVEILDEEEFEDIEEIDVALLGQCDNWLTCPTNKVTKQDIELNPYIINNIRENTLGFQHKINQLIKNQKRIIEKLNKNNITQ